jgi:hypothetical protein
VIIKKEGFTVLHRFDSTARHTYLTIGIDETVPCVVDVWTGAFGSRENFRNGVEKVVEVLIEKKYSKWLADLSRMEGSWDSSREWMLKELMPRAIKDVFARLSTQDTVVKLHNYQLRQFDDWQQAREWLKSQ